MDRGNKKEFFSENEQYEKLVNLNREGYALYLKDYNAPVWNALEATFVLDAAIGAAPGNYIPEETQRLRVTEHQMAAIKVHAANIQRLTNKWGRLKLSGPIGAVPGGVSGDPKTEGSTPKTVLDERLFRRVQIFNGDLGKYRGWLFDLSMVFGFLDPTCPVQLQPLSCIYDATMWTILVRTMKF